MVGRQVAGSLTTYESQRLDGAVKSLEFRFTSFDAH